jgi:hypothetical protein
MEPEIEPLFPSDECRTREERRFVQRLSARAARWVAEGWVTPEDLYSYGCPTFEAMGDERGGSVPATCWVLFVDVCGDAGVLRSLRVEYCERWGLRLGKDATGQDHPHDPARHDVTLVWPPASPGVDDPWLAVDALADRAAAWLGAELARPVERHEWDGEGFLHRRWVFADTGRVIVWSDSANEPRKGLTRAPDRVELVRGGGVAAGAPGSGVRSPDRASSR